MISFLKYNVFLQITLSVNFFLIARRTSECHNSDYPILLEPQNPEFHNQMP